MAPIPTHGWTQLQEILGAHDPVPDLTAFRAILDGGAPKGRRFLLMASRGAKSVSWCWVDDDGACAAMDGHRRYDGETPGMAAGRTPWHLYDARPTLFGVTVEWRPHVSIAIRCPSSLSEDEWRRVEKDEPLGRLRQKVHEARRDLVEDSRKPRKFGVASSWEDDL